MLAAVDRTLITLAAMMGIGTLRMMGMLLTGRLVDAARASTLICPRGWKVPLPPTSNSKTPAPVTVAARALTDKDPPTI
jgi:hypothetical protein